MYFRQLLDDDRSCASYLLGCRTHAAFAVVDPHADLVDEYAALAEREGVPIVAVFETHVHADHVSGLPELVARTGATAYLPAGAGVEIEHRPLADGEVVELGNTELKAIATPGHAAAHHAYLVTDRSRGDVPWLVLTGGRGLSSNPISSIGFERRRNRALAFRDEEEFAAALLRDLPPPPADQAEIVAANRSGRPLATSR